MSERSIEDILDEFVRTYVTFRPVKCETVGHSLRWTFEPVIHDTPVPPEDMTIYNTGDGVQLELGTFRAAVPPGTREHARPSSSSKSEGRLMPRCEQRTQQSTPSWRAALLRHFMRCGTLLAGFLRIQNGAPQKGRPWLPCVVSPGSTHERIARLWLLWA